VSNCTYYIGDTRDVLATIPDNSVDMVMTSPPFLALRSYLPADHPDKHREIGSEPTPAEFLDTLLALTADWERVLAPHGSIVVELGDTYAGGGGAGGNQQQEDTWTSANTAASSSRDGSGSGAATNARSGSRTSFESRMGVDARNRGNTSQGTARKARDYPGQWPLAKSLCGIPHLYHLSLAYGRNLLTGESSPAGQWRVRNVVAWCRPNPPVGALGDKFRPATSYLTIATKSATRYFDLDAVRTAYKPQSGAAQFVSSKMRTDPEYAGRSSGVGEKSYMDGAGAPPLDWWEIPTAPYKGSHYAVYPPALLERPIKSMCPQQVCAQCGEPRRRIVEKSPEYAAARAAVGDFKSGRDRDGGLNGTTQYVDGKHTDRADNVTIGFTDCGHDSYRNGVVLDPFGGSGTTGMVATGLGRDAILIDLDERNADLARDRIGMFLTVTDTREVAS